MIVVALLFVLALFDVLLSGFRAAAGRDGRIAKAAYYRAAVVRAGWQGVALIAANAALVALLVGTAAEPAATWQDLQGAGSRAMAVFAVFATVTLIAILFWFAPSRELRIVPTLLVLGPLTLVRPWVVVGGLAYAAAGAARWETWIVAAIAGVSMIGIEPWLGRPHRERWRRLV
jgi:hypothetical protein